MAPLLFAAGSQTCKSITRSTAVGQKLGRVQRPAVAHRYGRISFSNARLVRTKATEEVKTEESSEEVESESAASKESSKTSVTEEEIAAMVAERRAAKAEAAKNSNVITGAVEEAQLIIWPGIGEALVNTASVIAVVFVTSAMLFGVNTGLASLSNWFYSSNKKAEIPASQEADVKPTATAPSASAPQASAPAPGPVPDGESNIPSEL